MSVGLYESSELHQKRRRSRRFLRRVAERKILAMAMPTPPTVAPASAPEAAYRSNNCEVIIPFKQERQHTLPRLQSFAFARPKFQRHLTSLGMFPCYKFPTVCGTLATTHTVGSSTPRALSWPKELTTCAEEAGGRAVVRWRRSPLGSCLAMRSSPFAAAVLSTERNPRVVIFPEIWIFSGYCRKVILCRK